MHESRWMSFEKQAIYLCPSLAQIQTDFDLKIDFGVNPKMKALLEVMNLLK
jgi:hypothetical protein